MIGKVKILSLIIIFLAGGNTLFSQRTIKDKKFNVISTSSNNEIAPIITNNGIIYNSDRQQGGFTNWKIKDDQLPAHLYYIEQNENGGWSTPKIFSENIHFNSGNQSTISLNFNEDMAVFSRDYEISTPGSSRRVNPNQGLYFIRFDGSSWTDLSEFEHNDRGYKFLHPSLSAMGDVLYFSSNKPGGFGEFDIYVSKFQNGSWTVPENLGPAVNTDGNEIFPYLHSTGRLYFSSDRHDNRADYDIFYTDFFNGRWFTPVKLGLPFNGGRDDFTYVANEDFTSGYFTSNRGGSYDIFSFESTLPEFELCKQQQTDNYCYVFFEENTVSLDTNLYVYEWNMGDGAKVMATEAEHCYPGPGDYLVELNVVDRLTGIVEFNQAEYLVEVRKIIQPYISGPDTVILSQEIQMHGTESYLGDAVPGEFYWDYGDGEKEIGAAVRHIYRSPGTFTLKLGIIEDSNDPETARRYCTYKTIIVNEN